MADLAGLSLGRYQILERLGEGGMAVVYRALDTRLDSPVAVKFIRVERLAPEIADKTVARFEREAKALARLTHPHIVKVIDYGEYEGRPYLVMVYLPGGTLKRRLGTPWPWREAARFLAPVARALEYAHGQGFVHRDVKPSNILLTATGLPMLSDFGIVKLLDEETTADLTGTRATLGTPEYMAPEQGLGKPIDERVDVYSLGVVCYELITGRKPFTADTPLEMLFKHVSEPLPRPSQLVPDLPDSVEQMLMRSLAKKPEERWQMGVLADVLEQLSAASGQPGLLKPHSSATDEQTTDLVGEEEMLASPVPQADLAPAPPIRVSRKGRKPLLDRLSVTLVPGVEMVFVHVPAGQFWMGSEAGTDYADEMPRHEVHLDEYWIGWGPVTNAQYLAFAEDAGIKPPHYLRDRRNAYKVDHPVVWVSWHDAVRFCEWASQKSGEVIRLPTEAEWEKAARGVDNRLYPWGNNPPNRGLCNYNRLFFGGTTEVGKYSPQGDSPYGCTDMAGNVWEWVNDWYGENYYRKSPSHNPPGPSRGQYRVLRGGSWLSTRNIVRSAYRNGGRPDGGDVDIGFRCALSR